MAKDILSERYINMFRDLAKTVGMVDNYHAQLIKNEISADKYKVNANKEKYK